MAPLNLEAGHPPDEETVTVEANETPKPGIKFDLGFEDEDGADHQSRPLFIEMGVLNQNKRGEVRWKEAARWVKFEEEVEAGANRWSKPHVPTLSLHSLLELRSHLLGGTVLLDSEATTMNEIARDIVNGLVEDEHLDQEDGDVVYHILTLRHKHLYEKKHGLGTELSQKLHKSGSGFFAKHFPSTGHLPSVGNVQSTLSMDSMDSDTQSKGNKHFMKKLSPKSEAGSILVAEIENMTKPVATFVRLQQASILAHMMEVNVPTRFLFLIIGPPGERTRLQAVGRSMATLLSDSMFLPLAYSATERGNLLSGLDEFLNNVTVLPPGLWDPKIRIEPPSHLPSMEARRKSLHSQDLDETHELDEEAEEELRRKQSGLVRTGRLFGGLVNDIKRKLPHYASDFKDAFAMQTVSSFFFLYFACLSPIITFGGLLGTATGNNIAAMESLVAGLISGVIYGFFSGQPLTILGSTGPVLVFETILYEFCTNMGWYYLSIRMWIGLWAALILLILVALDASAFVCYITRFTEENFATLIALIFIIKAIENVVKIGTKYPMETFVDSSKDCLCVVQGELDTNVTHLEFSETFTNNVTSEGCVMLNGTWIDTCEEHYYPDVYLLSIMLFLGTFLVSIYLKDFKAAPFFPSKVRTFVSDFAVIIAIFAMTIMDMAIGIHTPKLEVPEKFAPTIPGRGWVVPPFGNEDQNPWWTSILAIVPALLVTILLFMDQQITAVIVNRKEFKLKKGCGYHLDLFILSILIIINSVMGLPWFVAATVLAINHVNSLKVESECAAPGEKPQFLGVRENRATNILIFLFIGLSVLMTPLLRLIPMPVLYGVFLYMGFSALKGIQMFDRLLILFMPAKYQPDVTYLREVQVMRVHLFTCIQVVCLAGLWIIKSFSQTSILFPIMLVVMIGVRKCLDWVFTEHELKMLDDILPHSDRHQKLAKKEQKLKAIQEAEEKKKNRNKEKHISISLANGTKMKIPVTDVEEHPEFNMSKEMSRTNLWKRINSDLEHTNGSQKPGNNGKDVQDPERGYVNFGADLESESAKTTKQRTSTPSKNKKEKKNVLVEDVYESEKKDTKL